MEEHDAGITEYTTVTAGFCGTLKHRYEDFQVFEIDARGRTARITTLEPPQPEQPAPKAQLTDSSLAELTEDLQQKAGVENASRLATLLRTIQTYQQQHQQQKPPPQQESAQPSEPDITQQADAAQTTSSDAAEGAASGPAQAGASNGTEQGPPCFVVHLLPINDKEARKALHTFLKTDPRLPPLATDTVTAASGPEAAAAAAAAPAAPAAPAAAAQNADKQQQQRQQQEPAPDAAEQAKKASEVPNIIRVTFHPAEGGPGQGQRKGGKDARGKNRGWQNQWAGGANKFVKFVLHKENMDTQAALTVVGRMLRLHSQAFGFAGTKDRRGVTTQYVTLFKVDPSKLAGLNPRLRGIKLGNFEFCGSQLQLGQLRGNAFRILMRDVDTHDEQQIASAVSEVRAKGFINYFGLQRFGTGNVPTHRVGAALLRGEWRAAVGLIMQGTPHEKDDIRAARDKYTKHGNIKGCLDAMPMFMVAERAILQTLLKQGPNSYLQALQAVPRTLRSMYLHAWQSFCWNTAASERIRTYGANRVVAGDLVLLRQQNPGIGTDAAGGGADAVESSVFLGCEVGEVMAGGDEGGGDPTAAAAGGPSSAASRLAAVHVVAAAEAAAGAYSIQDVVLPLSGGQVQYPQHSAGWALYCRLGAGDGILLPGETDAEYVAATAATAAAAGSSGSNSVAAGSRVEAAAAAAAEGAQTAPAGGAGAAAAVVVPRQHAVECFSLAGLSGDYRRLLHVPAGLKHRVVHYSDINQPDLLPDELAELQQQQQRQRKREQQGGEQQKRQRQEPQAVQQQQQQSEGMEVDQAQAVQSGGMAGDAAGIGPGTAADVGEPAAHAYATAAAGSAAGGSSGDDSSRQVQRVGVVLEFSLPSSCYATMLIRELTKSSTSKAAHKQLSAAQP